MSSKCTRLIIFKTWSNIKNLVLLTNQHINCNWQNSVWRSKMLINNSIFQKKKKTKAKKYMKLPHLMLGGIYSVYTKCQPRCWTLTLANHKSPDNCILLSIFKLLIYLNCLNISTSVWIIFWDTYIRDNVIFQKSSFFWQTPIKKNHWFSLKPHILWRNLTIKYQNFLASSK